MADQKNTIWNYYYPSFEFTKSILPEQSPWWGHSFFAYDLVSNIKPKVIVELGTYKGNSFFSFAQAVKDNKLKTELHCVDTWEGDKHAGFYGDELFQGFHKVYKRYYNNNNIKIHKMFFDDALNKFKNNSIDLLHIDGLHTYDAVKHDFESWLPKVDKRNGIIILHDVCEIRDDFGVYLLWEELQKKYTTLTFQQYHGLGVIFLRRNPFEKNEDSKSLMIKYYEILASEQLLQITQKKSNTHIKILTEENRVRAEAYNALETKTKVLTDDYESMKSQYKETFEDAQEFRVFKTSIIWKVLSIWRLIKRKILSLIPD